jgi:CBS domain-containing protein
VQVADVMTEASVVESPTDTLRAAAEAMWRQQTGSLVVMDGAALVGIVTERDIMKAIARGWDPEQAAVSDVMTREVLTIGPESSLHEAARLMASRWIRHLPVVRDGGVVGVVSQRDLVGVFAALSRDPEGIALPATSSSARAAWSASSTATWTDGPMSEPTLPDTTTDESDVGWGDADQSAYDDDRRLLDDRPPHHEPRTDQSARPPMW